MENCIENWQNVLATREFSAEELDDFQRRLTNEIRAYAQSTGNNSEAAEKLIALINVSLPGKTFTDCVNVLAYNLGNTKEDREQALDKITNIFFSLL